MKHAKLSIAVLFLFIGSAYSQTYQGPEQGAYPSGVFVSTNSFTNQPAVKMPKIEKTHNKIRYKGEPWINNQAPGLPTEKEIYNEGASAGTEAGGVVLLKDFQGLTETNSIPPDPHVAVGPEHVVGVVNSDFAIWDKSGNLIKRIDAAAWFSAFHVDPFDPKVFYDHFAQRWVMVWLDQKDSPPTASFLISVSETSSPVGTWRNWLVPSSWNGNTFAGNWGDYQGVGFDETALYISANQWSFAGNFQYTKIRSIKKSDLYYTSTDTCKWYDFWNISLPGSNQKAFNIRPVVQLTPSDTAYFVHVPYYSGTVYAVYRMTYDNNGVPSLNGSILNVTGYQSPPQAAQPGGTAVESSGSELTFEPVYRDGSIYLVHSVANPQSPGYSGVRFCRFNPKTVTIDEQLTFGTPQTWYSYPAVTVDKAGNIVFTATRSSYNEFLSAYFVGKAAGNTSFTQPYLLKPGVSTYNKDYGGGRNRWGDYLGIAIDPAGENFWMMSEFVPVTSIWSNWIGLVRMMPMPGVALHSSLQNIDFKTVERGVDHDSVTVQLINMGTDPLVISSISNENSNFSLGGFGAFPVTVGSFDSLAVTVVCDPHETGFQNDTILVESNAAETMKIPVSVEAYDLNIPQPGKVLVVTNQTDGGKVFSINKSTGEATEVGYSGSVSFVTMEANPKTGVVYGLTTSLTDSKLWKMDANSGKFYLKATIPLSDATGASFDTSGVFYIVSKRNLLFKYNEEENSVTQLATIQTTVAAIAFEPFTNELFAAIFKPIGSGKDAVLRVNPATGDTSLVGNLGTNKPLRDIFFDQHGGLFGFMGTSSEFASLISIDRSNGAGTSIGSTGLKGLVSSACRVDVVNSVQTESAGSVVSDYKLYDNYPNPFNPVTVIKFAVPYSGSVAVNVYNTLGEKVAVLANGFIQAGEHTVQFDATNLTSGVYFYELKSENFRALKKMVLVK